MPEQSRAPTSSDVDTRLHEAVFNARVARHHRDCMCCQYRDADGEAFCTPAEWRFNNMVDRLIDRALQER